MHTIVPAVIPQSRAHLAESLAMLAPFARAVQIDIVDGIFVPSVSWPYTESASPDELAAHASNFDIEIDLMVQNPETVVEAYVRAGVKRIVIHLESTTQMATISALKQKYDFLLGISILNDTDVATLAPYIDTVDYVQCMGIAAIGSQGQPFDLRVLSRIATLHAQYPHTEISVDGSVTSDTIGALVTAGATRFAVGSAIMRADNPEAQYQELMRLANHAPASL